MFLTLVCRCPDNKLAQVDGHLGASSLGLLAEKHRLSLNPKSETLALNPETLKTGSVALSCLPPGTGARRSRSSRCECTGGSLNSRFIGPKPQTLNWFRVFVCVCVRDPA